jgi:osmoprotectant transport system permease protein
VMSEALAAQLDLLPGYLSHHLVLTLVALTAGIAVCLPLGLLVARVRTLQWPVLTLAGILQTIPGLALLALMVPLLGRIGFVPAVLALILYSFLPILRNTVTGILGVDPAIREAATGIGMTDMQRLMRIEFPLALPVIVAGIRTAAVWVVGTATLATPVGATSLGNFIFSGLQTQNVTAVLVGCVAAALLAVVLDAIIRLAEKAAARRDARLGLLAGMLLAALFVGGAWPVWALRSDEAGSTVRVGSKPFTEQYILAEWLTAELQADGWNVDARPSMGSLILFEALTSGEIDVYVDYSGTLWTNVLKRSDLPSRADLLVQLQRGLDSAYGVLCLGPLGFENTYALAVRSADAEAMTLRTLDDLAAHSRGLRIGSDYEFFSRPEWQSLVAAYGFDFADEITLDPSLMYSAIAQDEVDVVSAYSTDGRIIDYDLVTLADPRGALPPYDAVILVSARLAAHNQIRRVFERMLRRVDAALMREANRRVDQAGETPATAARFLQRQVQRPGAP